MISPRHFFRIMIPWLLILGALWATRPLAARTGPEGAAAPDKTLSPYFVVLSDDPEKDALPLKSTQAEVKIAGVVAEVKITQVYKNAGKKTLEAIYVFPASTRAAVHAMRMTIGTRVVEAQIMERQKARQTYEQARQEGKTTSLLEQQRPNVFQMNVANILPGDEIKVELKYMELLEPEDNLYEFVLPTVVGPRYSKMAAAGAPDTEKWVKNPYLHEGQAPPYTFGLTVDLNSGLPISQLTSPSHEVAVEYSGRTRALVKIKDEKTAGNKDFVLRYALAGGRIDAGLLLYPGPEENFFLVMMAPPARVKTKAVLPREYIFIVDVSGSMHGFPLNTAKALMQDIISNLRPQDFINVLLFESGSAVLSSQGSLPASDANKQKALAFIQARPGGGGTEILPAFKRALALPRAPKTSRIVVVATDGYVHVEPQVFDLIRRNLGEANLFAFGIGKSVNRHLIQGMARAGLGEPFVVLDPGEAAKQAARFRRYIAQPVLTDIKVSFEGFQASDLEPLALPDLFALRPVTLLGKYQGGPGGKIVVQGKTAQGDFRQEIKVTAAAASPENSALRLLWARHRIMRLADLSRLGKDDPRIKEVTDLGLKYSLMTPYTSFVAVDRIKRADGQVVTVKQPLPLPEGVSDLAVGGGRAKMMAMRSHAPGAGMGLAALEVAPSKPWGKTEEARMGPRAAPEALRILIVETRVKGDLDQAALEKTLEASLPKLLACCQEILHQGGKLPKEVTLAFTIGADGKITGKVAVQAPPGTEALVKCLRQKVQEIGFPKAEKKSAAVTVKLAIKGPKGAFQK